MNMVVASQIIFGAESGLMVGVNAVAVKPTDDDGVTHEYGPRIEKAAVVALGVVAAALLSKPVDISGRPPTVGEPMENGPTILPLGRGQVNVFSDSNGLSSLPGFFDLKYTLALNLKQKEE